MEVPHQMSSVSPNLPPILPLGTRVVSLHAVVDSQGVETRMAGEVGVIVRAPDDPDHRYSVRFVDGEVLSFRRRQIEVFSHHKEGALGEPCRAEDLFSRVIYRCVVGSRAFGLSEDASDVDLRGIFLPPARLHWSLAGVPQIIERPGADECYWELERFLGLALKANPNILECLYSPLVELASPIAKELLELRSCFLSKFLHKTYNGYVLSQFKKLKRSKSDEFTISMSSKPPG